MFSSGCLFCLSGTKNLDLSNLCLEQKDFPKNKKFSVSWYPSSSSSSCEALLSNLSLSLSLSLSLISLSCRKIQAREREKDIRIGSDCELSMEAIRKQASKLREQVARQQQVSWSLIYTISTLVSPLLIPHFLFSNHAFFNYIDVICCGFCWFDIELDRFTAIIDHLYGSCLWMGIFLWGLLHL